VAVRHSGADKAAAKTARQPEVGVSTARLVKLAMVAVCT
jgi:hypothetical protein